MPGQLSGGQQQRVALARALVAQPAIMLFDEPLSNLDALLREQLRADLHALHRELGFTGVYVTHDLAEALALGDQVAVMSEGLVVQVGDPRSVFENPATKQVARLLGLRTFGSIKASDGNWVGDGTTMSGELPPRHFDVGQLDVLARPQYVQLREPTEANVGGLRISPGVIIDVSYLGSHMEAVVDLGVRQLRIPSERTWHVGDTVVIDIPANQVQYYQEDGTLWAGRRQTPMAATAPLA
jgi:iron(III) transport system ATP-binding protein